MISRGSRRNGRVRSAKGGGSAARKLAYIERGGEHIADAEDVLATGRSGPDLGTWACADRAELRKDAVVCRQIICVVPNRLPLDQLIKIAQAHADRIRRETGCAVRWGLHRAGDGDERNTHVHFLISARPVSDQGIFAESKATRFDRKLGGRQFVADLRADWQETVNDALRLAGSSERLDLRTRAAQGLQGEALQRIPMIEYQMARRGERYSPKYESNQLILALRSATDACTIAQSNLARFKRAVVRCGERVRRTLGIQQIARRRIAVASGASRLAASVAGRARLGRDRGYGLARPVVSASGDLCAGDLHETSTLVEGPQTRRQLVVDSGIPETLRGNEADRRRRELTDSEYSRSVGMASAASTAGSDSARADATSDDGTIIRLADHRLRADGEGAQREVDGVLSATPPNGGASRSPELVLDDGRRAATGVHGGKSNPRQAAGPGDGTGVHDSGGTRNARRADASSGGTLIAKVWRWLSRRDRIETDGAIRPIVVDAATVLKRAREDALERLAVQADQARARIAERIEERSSKFVAGKPLPLLQITTPKGSIYYVIADDWRDAQDKVDVPLCDLSGIRLEEGKGKRARLRRSTIETCKVVAVSAVVARTPDIEPTAHDKNSVGNLFAKDEKTVDNELTLGSDSL